MEIKCSRRSSGETIRALVEAVNDSNVAASTQAAFDGVNRDDYF